MVPYTIVYILHAFLFQGLNGFVYHRKYQVCMWVQVVNLEFYLKVLLCLSPGFEPQVGRAFDFIRKNQNQKDSIVESALQRG